MQLRESVKLSPPCIGLEFRASVDDDAMAMQLMRIWDGDGEVDGRGRRRGRGILMYQGKGEPTVVISRVRRYAVDGRVRS